MRKEIPCRVGKATYGLVKASLLAAHLSLLSIALAIAQAPIPQQAQAVGYTVLTFYSKFEPHTVDTSQTKRSGFQWYLWDFFGEKASPTKLSFGRNDSLTLTGKGAGPSGNIATATPTKTKGGFVGIAFGGGGYFEATLKFDPKDVQRSNYVGWPAFWSMALGHLIGNDARPGTFQHFIEADFFEYDLLKWLHVENVYGGALRDWYGVWKRTCPKNLCNVTTRVKRWVPLHTDFRRYHTYGFLWVPATSATAGYARFYFDNNPVGNRVTWHKYSGYTNPSKDPTTIYSIIDQQHLVLILGTGINEPMTVKSVRVYQSTLGADLIN